MRNSRFTVSASRLRLRPVRAERAGTPRGRARRRGAIFVDMLVGVLVLAMGAAAYFSMYPVVHRSQKMAHEETVAIQLAARMVEHIQLLRPADINEGSLMGLQLINSDSDGQPWSFSTIPLDQGSGYSPAQALRKGQGYMTTQDLSAGSKLVRIEIRWTSPSGTARSFTTGTILGGYR